jgi:hypothetical protein
VGNYSILWNHSNSIEKQKSQLKKLALAYENIHSLSEKIGD